MALGVPILKHFRVCVKAIVKTFSCPAHTLVLHDEISKSFGIHYVN